MAMAETIRAALTAALAPTAIELVDESRLHAGHAGARPGGESHFALRVVAPAFEGLSRLERQRRVYRALGGLVGEEIHALRVSALTPAEAAAGR